MSDNNNARDPLEFISNMWNNMGFTLPGIVTPTLDIEELDKRIHDLKAVEHWLKVNLNMLQMTTQGLEMQRATLAAVKAMSETTSTRNNDDQAAPASENPFAAAASLWPWSMMTTPPAETADKAEQDKADKPKTRSGSANQTGARAGSRSTARKE